MKKREKLEFSQKISDMLNETLDLTDDIDPENMEKDDKFVTKFTKRYNDEYTRMKTMTYFEISENYSFEAILKEYQKNEEKVKFYSLKKAFFFVYR